MKAPLTAIFVILIAGQAGALSCMRPDVATTFNRMHEVPEDVYVLRGVLEFDESLLPEGVVNEERFPDPIAGTFKGKGLTLDGFTARFESDVTVQSVCFGPWCGSLASGIEVITFANVIGDDIIIEANPCGSNVFPSPTQEMADALQSCIRGEACETIER